jgi:gliding motility-associated-like protein
MASLSQLEADNWIFSYHYYINFQHATRPDTMRYPPHAGGLGLLKGTITYSDKSGNLLFYNGFFGRLYDRTFNFIPSTDFVYPGVPLYTIMDGEFVSQPYLAVPYPGHESRYIIFHIKLEYVNGNYKSSLYYSVMDMNLRGGLGDVVPGMKNILLLNGAEVGFKLTATLHCNKKHIWVTGHLQESDKYYSLLVTENGIDANPVYFTGNYIPKRRVFGTNVYDLITGNGCIKASALGNRMAAAFMGMGFVELMDFNIQTGVGSNLKTITAMPPPADTMMMDWHLSGTGPYGIEFSPSGKQLYVSSSYHLRNINHYNIATFLYQFDAALGTETLVQNSKQRIMFRDERAAGALQLANNGRIYLNMDDELSEISNPEAAGLACGYTDLNFNTGTSNNNRNLPVFLQSYFRYPIIATGNCQFQNISFSIPDMTGVSSIQWDFGDPASGGNNISTSFTPMHIFSTQGVYEVKAVLQNANGCGADTIRKIVYTGPFRVDLGNDITICEGDTAILRMNVPNATNVWSTGSRDTLIRITQSGQYWVRTNIGECFASDTINITVRALPAFSLGNDLTICSHQSVVLAPTPNPVNVSYLWSTGATSSSINTISDGLYWLQVTENDYGCRYKDSTNVVFKTLPEYSLGADKTICEKDTVVLDATVNGATSYSWNTGSTSPRITAYNNGIYWADVSKDGCVFRDSVQLTLKPLPVVNLGNDSTLCEGNVLRLDAENIGSQYLWQNNSTGQSYDVNRPGTYYVRVTKSGCIVSDTISVKYDYKPIFSLGKDTVICNGQSIVLKPIIQNGTNGIGYLWNTGEISPVITINQPGYYQLTISNYCGTRNDEIKVSEGVCKLYVPTAFTPNNDGKNDVFKASYGENVTSYQMDIYNRWGQKIFSSNQINNGWDGKLKGEIQPGDVYVWIIRYKILNDETSYLLKGTFTLIL